MKKLITVFLMSLSLQACGKNTLSVEAPYNVYVSTFQARAQMVGTSVQVNNLIVETVSSFSDPNILGQCLIQGGMTPTVQVSAVWWSKLNTVLREQLVFHELGHCVLNRLQHRPDMDGNYPLSIMNAYEFNSDTYQANYEQYIYELFKNEDLQSQLPLIGYNSDPSYLSWLSGLFNTYSNSSQAVTSNAKVQMLVDDSAPTETSPEVIQILQNHPID